ncbi:MAG: gamma-glutamyltransferase [Longimicrobiales bacterium]
MLLTCAALLFSTCAPPAPTGTLDIASRVPAAWAFQLNPEVASAPAAMVVTDAPLATEVGVEVLRNGGNAVDAAVATAFALAVVYPEAGNIGGGGFMVTRMADGTVASLDFREKAPLAATRDMYLDSAGNTTDLSITGPLSAGVPGSVAGLFAAHERFGTVPWADLLAPAIQLADSGFSIDASVAGTIRGEAERLERFEASAALFLPGGEPLAEGTHWRNPDLAAVLRRIAERGPAGFYEGETARLIVAEMQRTGGLITLEDLNRYTAEWREPIVFDYRDHTVISMPPPSSGGITLALIAQVMEGFIEDGSGWHSAAGVHHMAEAMRRAFADRNHFLGDPDFVEMPRTLLLSDDYAERLRATITDRATPSAEVIPGLGLVEEGAQLEPAGAGAESDHTTHFSIVDAQGNAVALTTTINNLYGSAVTVAGAGFLLNDEMDDFTSKPGEPNLYGLVQGEANAIEPEKRMLSAMTPTIVVAPDGTPLLVTGARGGPRIITAVYQVFSNVIDHGMDVGTAVHAPRIHHQHLPDVLYFEPSGLAAAIADSLRALGHTVEERSGYIGTAPAILRSGDVWTAVPDPRTGGLAAGY